MSCIQKLKIRGVRAFPENAPATLEIYAPLTLIVGQNGTGKTTIVEALKYATTGSLPPNSKNGAFVHDPRLSHEAEARAQVMMKFVSCEGKELIVVRGMSQSLGRTKKETKTLESALWEISGGEKRLLCNKLSGLDTEVPILLGTTAAVLESVIFCHQEESTWPLGDPAVMKKKMEGIFSSSRFIKALEALKVLKREKTTELKLQAGKHEGLQQKAQTKRKIEQRAARAKERENELEREIGKAAERLAACCRAQKEKHAEYEQKLLLLREKEKAESELAGLSTKPLVPGTPAELEELLLEASSSKSVHTLQKELHALEEESTCIGEKLQEYHKLEIEAEYARKEREALLLDVSVLSSESLQEVRAQCAAIETSYSSVARMDALEGQVSLSSDFSLPESVSFFGALQILSSLASSFSSVVKRSVESIDEKIFSAERSLITLGEELAIARDKHGAVCRKKERTEEMLARCLEETEESFMEELHEHTALVSTPYTAPPSQKEGAVRKVGILQARVEEALVTTEQRKEKEFLQKEIQKKEKDMHQLLRVLEIPAGTQESLAGEVQRIQEEVRAVEAQIEESRAQSKTYAEQLSQKDAHILAQGHLRAYKVLQAEEILSQISTEISTPAGPITKQEALQKIKDGRRIETETQTETERHTAVEELREKLGGLAASEAIYTEFLSRAQQECPFCKHPLSTGAAKGHFQKIEAILECARTRKTEIQDALEEARSTQKEQAAEALAKRLLSELSSLTLPSQIKENTLHRPTADNSEERRKALHRKLLKAEEARQKHAELDELKKREASIVIASPEYHEVLKEYRASVAQLQQIEQEEEQEARKRKAHEEAQARARARIQEIERLMERRKEGQSSSADLGEEHAKLKKEKDLAEALIKKKSAEIEEVKKEEAVLLRTKAELLKLAPSPAQLVPLLSAKQRVSEMTARADGLRSTEFAQKDLALKEDLLQQRSACCAKIESAKDLLGRAAQAEQRAQVLKDSLRACALHGIVEHCAVTLEALQEIQRESREIDGSILLCQQTISKSTGEKNNLKAQREEDVEELAEYKDAEEEELSAFITTKVLKESLGDIDKYTKEVEAAIVRYHSEKLAEVNSIIKEIWGMTYKGGDIDNIRIHPQNDKSYVLMMEKDGVDVEMRGRVSAGQKMLASIVVRLALAEAFSINCGLLSLDEPTTNLDKENISGLAHALSSIVQARKAEGSFQLLIITHDEEFVRELLRTECTEYFYRIHRDAHMVPKVERLSIYEA
ncbi:DNA repair protein RAD50 [Nematocida sp. AWRm77]|nr:DNA repair protein RAD50 [Nematocida sp. AWRm77]